MRQPSSSVRWRTHPQQRRLPCASPPGVPGYNAGVASFTSQHSEPLQRCFAPGQLPASHAPPWGDCGLCPRNAGDTTTQCKVACPRSWTKPPTCPCPSKRSGRSTSPFWRAGTALCCRHRALRTGPPWADCLPAIRARAPEVAAQLLQTLQATASRGGPAGCGLPSRARLWCAGLGLHAGRNPGIGRAGIWGAVTRAAATCCCSRR